MRHGNDKDFDKLTFSQRESKAPLPESMQLGHIPRKFRQLAWKSLEEEISRLANYISDSDDPYYSYLVSDFHEITNSYHFDILEKPHDEIRYDIQENSKFIRDNIWNGTYHEVLTLIEYILRDKRCSENLHKNLVDAFDTTPTAYFVADKGGLPTIMPRPSRGQAVRPARRRNKLPRRSTKAVWQAQQHTYAKRLNRSTRKSMRIRSGRVLTQ